MEALKMNYRYEQAILYLNDKENILNRNLRNNVLEELIKIEDELDKYTVEIEDIDDLMTFIQYRLAEVQATRTMLKNGNLNENRTIEMIVSQIKNERKLELAIKQLSKIREWRI